MNKPFFSIVIPLYQKEDYISRAIDSVVFQTFRDFELLIVDDGSTDSGPEIVSRYSDKRIRLIKQTNQGVSAARNRGIEEAKANYIAFLDADDKWESSFLAEMKRLIITYPDCGWYSCRRTMRYKKGNSTPSISNLQEGVITDFFEAAQTNYIVDSSSVVIPKSVFTAVGGYNTKVKKGEDILLWIAIASQYPVCFTPSILSNYYFDQLNADKRMRIVEPDYYLPLLQNDGSARDEYIADYAIHKGIDESIYGSRALAIEISKNYQFTRVYKNELRRLSFYNQIPQNLLYFIFELLKQIRKVKLMLLKR